jgi:hypothetical protein
MLRRVDQILSISAAYGHDAVVLGAFGCGVFKNDPSLVADYFARALATKFRSRFKMVVFAVLDSQPFLMIQPFQDRFASGALRPIPHHSHQCQNSGTSTKHSNGQNGNKPMRKAKGQSWKDSGKNNSKSRVKGGYNS